MPRYCAHPDCQTKPNFGLELKRPTHCKEHAGEGMFDVISKRCAHSNCQKQPAFGLEPKKPTHCKTHASEGMFDVISKRCAHPDCQKIPSFGLEIKKPTHCKEHAGEGMFDVISKRCAHSNCQTRPKFGLELKKATHCKEHAGEGMFDVINKRCSHPDCQSRPAFGLKLKKATHCKEHAGKGMFDVISKRCAHPDCQKIPSFGLELKKATHCKTHASEGMFDVSHKRCITCDSTTMNRKYKPNCARCHFYLHPDDPRIRNYKVKEHAFMLALQKSHPEMVLDQTVSGGCSKRRPDGLLDCLTHSIIVEIDEDQHVGYESMCDNRRTMELFSDLGRRPIIFIRLNPDKYSLDGKTTKGCFQLSKNGDLQLRKTEFAHRFEALQESVVQCMANIPARELSYVKLFYSE